MGQMRSRRGSGSLFQRSRDGLWTFTLSLGFDKRGKRIRRSVCGRTREEALSRAIELQLSIPRSDLIKFEDPEGVVYFALVEEIGRVKIGFSAQRDHMTRISELSCGCPAPLKVVATIPGTQRDERALHRFFANYHAHLEWFRYDGALKRYIEAVADGTILEPLNTGDLELSVG